jgi:hypothetical protein
MKEFFKNLIKLILFFIGSIAVLIGIIYLIKTVEHHANETIYNNGVCTNCGGHYEFVSASRYKQTTYYYYQCDNCEKIIELRH